LSPFSISSAFTAPAYNLSLRSSLQLILLSFLVCNRVGRYIERVVVGDVSFSRGRSATASIFLRRWVILLLHLSFSLVIVTSSSHGVFCVKEILLSRILDSLSRGPSELSFTSVEVINGLSVNLRAFSDCSLVHIIIQSRLVDVLLVSALLLFIGIRLIHRESCLTLVYEDFLFVTRGVLRDISSSSLVVFEKLLLGACLALGLVYQGFVGAFFIHVLLVIASHRSVCI